MLPSLSHNKHITGDHNRFLATVLFSKSLKIPLHSLSSIHMCCFRILHELRENIYSIRKFWMCNSEVNQLANKSPKLMASLKGLLSINASLCFVSIGKLVGLDPKSPHLSMISKAYFI